MNDIEAMKHLEKMIERKTVSGDPFYLTQLAIENLIKRVKELEEIEEEHRKENGELQQQINELKQEIEYYNCIIESDEENYINKDKIKEKIKELKGFINDCIISEKGKFCESCKDRCFFNEEIKDLQELLEEEK